MVLGVLLTSATFKLADFLVGVLMELIFSLNKIQVGDNGDNIKSLNDCYVQFIIVLFLFLFLFVSLIFLSVFLSISHIYACVCVCV